jgi:hypothetical protein
MAVSARSRDIRSTGAPSFALLMLLDRNTGFFANRVEGAAPQGVPDRRERVSPPGKSA